MPRSAAARRRQKRVDALKEIFDYFGNRCQCCGESNPIFFTIDHVQNDGYKEQHVSPLDRYLRLLRRIRASEVITDRQLLCFNCNCGRARNGGICPHQAMAGTPVA